jgi:hypothetical protein
MDDFLGKPIVPADLRGVLDRWLHRADSSQELAASADTEVHQAAGGG